MSYEVLARKYRPHGFQDLVGQEHVARALVHALDAQRIHHALLFTGTRGVGKTTIARIVAKALNCESGVSGNPCGACDSCQSVVEGRFVDLQEIDAASRTGIDDMRELIDNVQYAPVVGNYKVYLIDEVHMLSTQAFNALLKTLEEPPPHVVFILATTDPKKVPVTVLSRCLQFHLKNHLPVAIAEHLANVMQAEQIDFEPGALTAISRAADGSMRDALSLTDQAIAFGGGKLTTTGTAEMLGNLGADLLFSVVEAILKGDGSALLSLCQDMAVQGADFDQVLVDLALVWHRLMVIQTVGDSAAESVELILNTETLVQWAEQVSPEVLQLYYQIVTDGRAGLRSAPDPRSGFEVTMLRLLAFRPASAQEFGGSSAPSGSAVSRGKHNPASAPQAGSTHSSHRAQSADRASSSPEVAEAEKIPSPSIPASAPPGELDDLWYAALQKIPLDGVLRSIAERCVLVAGGTGDEPWQLVLDERYATLYQDRHREQIAAALADAGLMAQIEIRIAAVSTETPAQRRDREYQEAKAQAQQTLINDAGVQGLLKTFNAVLLEETVEPRVPGRS